MFKKILCASVAVFAISAFAEEVKWKVPNGFDQASSSIPKGALTASTQYPTRNYGNRACRIYTPPGYSATRAEKYPVLYLHHGIGGNENAWTSTNGQAEGNADKVMDYLYAQASLNVVPMIVVMPMGNMTGTSGDAWQNFEDVLMNDLVPYIQKNYNASPDANMRAIAGLSMGAGQTCNFGYKNPKFFTWMGAFSPAPNTIAAATTIKDMAAVKANVHLAYFGAGTAETMYLNNARNYHNYLNQNGVTPLYLNIIDGLNHERANWNQQLHQFAQRIFKGVTPVAQAEPLKIAPAADRSAMLVRGLSPTPWTMNIVRPGTALTAGQVFSLDGRMVTQMRTNVPESRLINRTK
jgi:enterochelin esterase-like enzyme